MSDSKEIKEDNPFDDFPAREFTVSGLMPAIVTPVESPVQCFLSLSNELRGRVCLTREDLPDFTMALGIQSCLTGILYVLLKVPPKIVVNFPANAIFTTPLEVSYEDKFEILNYWEFFLNQGVVNIRIANDSVVFTRRGGISLSFALSDLFLYKCVFSA